MRDDLSKSAGNLLSRSESYMKSQDFMREDDERKTEITERMQKQRNSLKIQIEEKLERRLLIHKKLEAFLFEIIIFAKYEYA